VVVIDALGVGALPDAPDYGDAGADTLVHVAETEHGLALPTLQTLGLGSIVPIAGVAPADTPVLHGRLSAIGPGKDSTVGHWALMGVSATAPLPTYPEGFPPEVLTLIESVSGRAALCNRPYNGISVIDDFAAEHLASGKLIVYTSQDSVLQIAAHVELVPPEELYRICEAVRAGLPSNHAVGRVIARPFDGSPGSFARTDGRMDLTLAPPGRSYLDALKLLGIPVHTVGKAGSLMAGRGVDVQHSGPRNAPALKATSELIESLDHGLVFTNLIDTDQVYGHRHDAHGFATALIEIDQRVGEWLPTLTSQDLLILTADHGCDPLAPHTDHTREYVPLLASFEGHQSRRHDGLMADVGASVLKWLSGTDDLNLPGTSFL
jgi:phosphopentomutase